MIKYLKTPLPRPKANLKNLLNIFLIGIIGSLFIIIFKPFNIYSGGLWYYDFIILSMGLVFSSSIYFIEFIIPYLLKRFFKNWNIGKGLLWYTLIIFFVSGVMFLYKSFLSSFNDFTFSEYINVIGRITGIGLIVTFFVLGIYSYVNSKSFTLIASNEVYKIVASNGNSLELNINEILYIKSDNNYVDIHLFTGNERKKILFRCSLKNIEDQLVNPLSPIFKCHRQYLININYVKIKNSKTRNASVQLVNYEDEIPVSSNYMKQIFKMTQIRN
ncbi:LytR/AlgR family response regulator transcription factor [Winogradskyella sp.]|uniref:LytR/AlgR family response regulator transcription factor n=1 Tax=Winogradskyella sp. TaxID=1883156 RepID=UPI003BAA8FB1